MPPCLLTDDSASAFGAGEGYPLHAGIGDDRSDLIVGGEDIGIGADREASFVHDLVDRQRGPGTDVGMLEKNGVPENEVGCGEASVLIVGEVPGHDPKQN